jgi:hypothetical protein
MPGDYKVYETPENGWVATQSPIPVTLSLDDVDDPDQCLDQVNFVNSIPADVLAQIRVQKITDPLGEEDGWNFDLSGTTESDSLMTAAAGFHDFDLNGGDLTGGADEGTYSITENGLKLGDPAWYQELLQTLEVSGCDTRVSSSTTSETACEGFTVVYPRDFSCTFSCTISNTQKGRIIIEKQTDPDGSSTAFGYTGEIVTSLLDGESQSKDVIPGSYSVSEIVPDGWDLTKIECDDSDSSGSGNTANFEVAAGETVKCTFYNRERGMVDLLKLTNGVEHPTMSWTFTLSGPMGDPQINIGDSTPPPLVDFDGEKLIPGETYTICETGIPPTWSLQWAWDANGNGVIDDGETLPYVGASTGNLLEVYDPSYGENGASNDVRCVDFQVGAAETLHFILDNSAPGGEPRTPGYWKNWNTCTGGNQANTAFKNGGVAENWFLLDDLIPTTIGELSIDTCEEGVLILDHRDLNDKKKASDGAYDLARNLLAAKLNTAAGACPMDGDWIAEGDALLIEIGFDGVGNPGLRPKDDLYGDALFISKKLDAYNNGDLCQ